MPLELIVDKPDIMSRIKSSDTTKVINDNFYSGLNFTLELSQDTMFDIFGCWNSNCTDRLYIDHMGSHQQAILSKLLKSNDAKYNTTNKIRFLIGDNIYYEKTLKKIQKENKEQLNNFTLNDVTTELAGTNFVKLARDLIDNGFRCFTAAPSFMALGNHDVEYPFILQYQIMKCFSSVEINGNKVKFGDWILPNAFYSIKMNIGTISLLFIIIDTNLLDPEEYIDFFPKSKKDEYKKKMEEWFESTLKENTSCVKIVLGHIPIFYYTHMKNKDKTKEEIEKEKKDKTKEEKKDKTKEEKKDKVQIGSRYNDFIKLYEIMIENNVSTYMCADEHNMQVLQDLEHGINHIICGASPGGGGSDEAYNLDKINLCFSNKIIEVPELQPKFNKKIIINAPSFTHLIVQPSLLQFNIVSSSNLTIHHKDEYCKDRKCLVATPIAQTYEIITTPKYRDIIAVYNCDEFNIKLCS
jgi:hypothetical protein